MSFENYTGTLSQFGFTHNQARVYLTIVQLGLTAVGPISKGSGVRREDVYRILPKLEQMGLIERVLGTPTKIRATPLPEAFSILVKQRQEEVNRQVSELATRAEQFLKQFRPNYEEALTESEGDQFSLISGEAAIMSKFADMIGKTRSAIDTIISARRLSRIMFTYPELLREVIKRSANVRIIVEISQDDTALKRNIESQVPAKAALGLRYINKSLSHYLISDDRESIFFTSMESEGQENAPILWTNNNNFIALLRKYFDELWPSKLSS